MKDLQETKLGRHHLLARLARGGMGIVWLARSEGPFGFEKLVVVKELKPELAADPVYREMFLEEARLAARLDHPNIVQTNEVGCEDDRLFMTLELLEGCSLHDAKKALGGALPLRLALRVLSGVLSALHYAHEQGIVHRDVSAQNVFLTYDGRVKLLDFGVAKTRAPGRQETKVGVLKGSIPYMSPDHADGGTIDRRADVFAVGVHLRELATGDRLWGDLEDVSVLRKLVMRELPPFPSDSRAPQALRAIAERAMAPRRADRYATALEMREAIEDYLAETDRGAAASRHDTLAELGVLLERSLGGERAALRSVVRWHATALDARSPALAATVPSAQDPLSLPSDALVTDPSANDDARRVSAASRPSRTSRVGAFALGAAASAILVGALGITNAVPVPAAIAAIAPPPVSAPAETVAAVPAAETTAVEAPAVDAPPSIATVASPSALDDAPPSPADDESELPPNPYAPAPSAMQLTR